MAIRRFSTSNLSGAKSSKLWDQETTPGTFESIATVIVPSAGQASISFTNIPQNYAHLQIRIFAQTNRTTYGLDAYSFTFNSDNTSNYRVHSVNGDGSGASIATASTNYVNFSLTSTVVPNMFGVSVMDIFDYTSTSKNKTIKTLAGYDYNSSTGISGYNSYVGLYSGLWFKTPEAITSIVLAPVSGTAFTQYSHFALYGIRGA